ncbi:MAG: hypothetical protein H3C27_08535 [Opitutaceae bacterium]|nr:hypothetical protein [Opitutaceae bacterium]
MEKAVILILLLFAQTGCGLVPWKPAKTPRATITAPGVSISQRGDTPAPASVNTATSKAALPVPAGSTVTVLESAENKGYSVALAGDSVLTVETAGTRATAPTAFVPPAPPSPADLADGRAVWFYRLALFAGLAAAGFGLVRDYDFVMIGGACVAVAAAVGLFVQRHPALFGVIGAGVALAAAGVFVWHWKLKPRAA